MLWGSSSARLTGLLLGQLNPEKMRTDKIKLDEVVVE